MAPCCPQVPVPIKPERRQSVAMKWIIKICRKKKGKNISDYLFHEIMAAYRFEVSGALCGTLPGERLSWQLRSVSPPPPLFSLCVRVCLASSQGEAIKKKIELHKQAEANRANSRLAQ